MKIHVGQLKTFGQMWWELIFRRFKVANRRRRTGWKVWRVKDTHKTGKSYPVFGGLLVHISYIHVYLTLGNTPTSCAIMKDEENFITCFSEIVEGKDFWDITDICRTVLKIPVIGHKHNLLNYSFASFSFSSVAQSWPTLCNPMDCSTPGLPVHHQLPESTQTHVHWVRDAIQTSHPLSSPFPPALNPLLHQGLFKWVSSSHQVAKVLEFQLQHQSFQWIFRTDFL